MTMNEFLDSYIGGGPGEYYFQVTAKDGYEINGGMFYRKQDARNLLLHKIINFLDGDDIDLIGDDIDLIGDDSVRPSTGEASK